MVKGRSVADYGGIQKFVGVIVERCAAEYL